MTMRFTASGPTPVTCEKAYPLFALAVEARHAEFAERSSGRTAVD
jgi:hypothetical protein